MAGKTKKVAENIPESNDNVIQGETRSGLKFSINAAVREDTRVLYLLTRMQKQSLSMELKNQALFDLLEVVFGSGDDFFMFQNEVAFRHKGVADAQSLMEEITDIFEAVKLKN